MVHRCIEWVAHKVVVVVTFAFWLGCAYIVLLLFAGVQPRIIG